MAREKEIPADVWKRVCDLKFKQARSTEDICTIIWREFKFKISRLTLDKRLNELRATFDDDNVGQNHKDTIEIRRHASRMRRAVLGEIDPAKLSNKEKLQLMMDDTFVAFQVAKKDNDVRRMDICLTSYARGALAIAALERMGLEDGGKNGTPQPLPGVRLGSKELGAHHAQRTGEYSLDPRKAAIEVLPDAPRLVMQEDTQEVMPGVSLGEARSIAESVEGGS